MIIVGLNDLTKELTELIDPVLEDLKEKKGSMNKRISYSRSNKKYLGSIML